MSDTKFIVVQMAIETGEYTPKEYSRSMIALPITTDRADIDTALAKALDFILDNDALISKELTTEE